MRQIVPLSLCAAIIIGSCCAAGAADVSTWRWRVAQCLREQQARDADPAKVIREASTFEVTPGMQQRSDPGADPLYSGALKAAAGAQQSGQ